MKKINKKEIEDKILKNNIFGSNKVAYTLTFNILDSKISYFGTVDKDGNIDYNNYKNILIGTRNCYKCNYATSSLETICKYAEIYFNTHELEDGKNKISFIMYFRHIDSPDESSRTTKILTSTCEYITDTLDLYVNILFLNGGISMPIIRIKDTVWKGEEILDIIDDSYLFNSYGLPIDMKTEETKISNITDLKVNRYNNKLDQLLDLYKFDEEDVLYSDTGEVLSYYNKSSRVGFKREYNENGWKDIVTVFGNIIDTTEYKKIVDEKYTDYKIIFNNGSEDIVRIYNDNEDKNIRVCKNATKFNGGNSIDNVYVEDKETCLDSVYNNIIVSKRYNNASANLSSLRIAYMNTDTENGEVEYVDLVNWKSELRAAYNNDEYTGLFTNFADVSGIKYSMVEWKNSIVYAEGDMEVCIRDDKIGYLRSHIYNKEDQLYLRDKYGVPYLRSENYEGYCEIYKDFMANFNKLTS